jgi:predicted Zn finger-like uncharacterized protein
MRAEIGDLEGGSGASDSAVMILTCPECATSYFVDDSRIPAGGRSVKCTSCGARWMATPDADSEPEPQAAEPEPDTEIAEVEAALGDETTALVDDLEITGPEITGLRPRPARRASPAKPAKTEGRAKAALWLGAAAAVAGLIGAVMIFRSEIVRLWPASSAAFAGIGLPVNEVGLVIEKVKFEPALHAGRPVLSVTGSVRNITKEAAASPPIRFSLLDKAGEPVAAKIARPIEANVPPGATRYFAVAIQDPPSTAVSLDVAFEAGKAAAHAAPHPTEAAPAHGPAPVEAQPLPAGSPDALPKHG